MKRVICMALGVFLLTGCSRAGKPGGYSRTVSLMGTFVQVKLAEMATDPVEVVNGLLEDARGMEKKFSVFDPESEVNALNIAGTQKVSPELFALIGSAGRISCITEGGFDITVAPALKANGFYKNMPADIRDKIPDGYSGRDWRDVTLGAGDTVILPEGVWIDLSGIAKGYIVDRMSGFLRREGIDAFLINAGGDIYCAAKANGDVWKIGIRRPVSGHQGGGAGRNVVITLGVRDMAVATSGDYENVVIDRDTGEALSHIIDPSVGKPGREVPSSITVIAPTCTEADALATGMMAMGREKAITLANTLEDVEIIVVECSEGRETIDFSRGAAGYVVRR